MKLPRIDCPACGRPQVARKKDGTLHPHRPPNWTPTTPWCVGRKA